jgi:hypothetical protein
MAAYGWIIAIIVIIVIAIIVVTFTAMSVSTRRIRSAESQRNTLTGTSSPYSRPSTSSSTAFSISPPTTTHTQITELPPVQVQQEPVIRVIRRRPSADASGTIVISIPNVGLPDPIRLPSTIPVYFKQQECSICKKDIKWSSRQTGWARCLATKKLLHGHCYTSAAATRASTTVNWCAVCNGTCYSGQPMRIEGKNI